MGRVEYARAMIRAALVSCASCLSASACSVVWRAVDRNADQSLSRQLIRARGLHRRLTNGGLHNRPNRTGWQLALAILVAGCAMTPDQQCTAAKAVLVAMEIGGAYAVVMPQAERDVVEICAR